MTVVKFILAIIMMDIHSTIFYSEDFIKPLFNVFVGRNWKLDVVNRDGGIECDSSFR